MDPRSIVSKLCQSVVIICFNGSELYCDNIYYHNFKLTYLVTCIWALGRALLRKTRAKISTFREIAIFAGVAPNRGGGKGPKEALLHHRILDFEFL